MSVRCNLTRLASITLLLAGLLVLSAPASAQGSVELLYFFETGCGACERVHAEVVEPLRAEYGDRLVIIEVDIANDTNFGFLLQLERERQIVDVSIPEVFIGADALIGPEQVTARLRERIEYYLAQGGVTALPLPPEISAEPTATPVCSECSAIHEAERTAAAERTATHGAGAFVTLEPTATVAPTSLSPTASSVAPPIYGVWFNQPGCDLCDRKQHDLQYVLDKYPQMSVVRLDVTEERALNQYLCLQAGLPENRHLVAPSLFIGKDALVGYEISGSAILAMVEPYLATGAADPREGWEGEGQSTAQQTIVERFRSFGLWTVLGAGLIDGVNPCAFATMIFLVSYLGVRRRKGREILLTGAAFTLGVFAAYLGVGLGMLKFLTAVPALATAGKWIYAVTMLLCLALAWGSWQDYRKARAGRLEDMSLKLPQRLRGLTHQMIREGSRAQNYVLASLALGFAVSIVELACTGQVYLPTIIFVLGLPEWRLRAALALVAYNVMFIVPLIIVFLLVYYGTTSKQLLAWMNRRAATVKLGTAVLFLVLAVWLGYSLVIQL